MSLCDELESRQQRRREVRIHLNDAALDRLVTASDPAEFAAAWQRVRDNFDLLYAVPENVAKLRQAILQLAVQGKLVPQDPSDEPVDSLLAQMHRQGTGRNGANDASAFAIPHHWRWICVKDAGEVQLGRQRAPKYHHGTNMVPYLRVQNVFEDRIDTSDVKEMHFSESDHKTYRLQHGDILLNEGQSFKLVGRPAIFRDEIPNVCFQNTLVRFRPYAPLPSEFALLVFRTYMHTGRFQRVAQQTTNIAHLSAGRFAMLEFPLPPLAEQHRIVARVNELMALCDDLETKLKGQREQADRVAQAVVNAVVNGRSYS
jgi:type I restriction enzyme S subunit